MYSQSYDCNSWFQLLSSIHLCILLDRGIRTRQQIMLPKVSMSFDHIFHCTIRQMCCNMHTHYSLLMRAPMMLYSHDVSEQQATPVRSMHNRHVNDWFCKFAVNVTKKYEWIQLNDGNKTSHFVHLSIKMYLIRCKCFNFISISQ